MVTLHEVITFLVSMQISISSLQTHNVNRCGRSRHLARKLSLRRKDRKSGSAGMPRPRSYAVFCLKKKRGEYVDRYGERQLLAGVRAAVWMDSLVQLCDGA